MFKMMNSAGHRGQKLPKTTRHWILLDIAFDYLAQCHNPAPRDVPNGWETHWSGEYKRWYFTNPNEDVSCWEHPKTRTKPTEIYECESGCGFESTYSGEYVYITKATICT